MEGAAQRSEGFNTADLIDAHIAAYFRRHQDSMSVPSTPTSPGFKEPTPRQGDYQGKPLLKAAAKEAKYERQIRTVNQILQATPSLDKTSSVREVKEWIKNLERRARAVLGNAQFLDMVMTKLHDKWKVAAESTLKYPVVSRELETAQLQQDLYLNDLPEDTPAHGTIIRPGDFTRARTLFTQYLRRDTTRNWLGTHTRHATETPALYKEPERSTA
jgi:hypothetical protein